MIEKLQREPIHPGIILKEEFAMPLSLTNEDLARALNINKSAVSEYYNKKRAITPRVALRLSKLFGTTPEFWLSMQDEYNLYQAYQKEKKEINLIVPISEFLEKRVDL